MKKVAPEQLKHRKKEKSKQNGKREKEGKR